jgi:hypothetical protein
MITFPRRVWLKTDNGWFSREANEFDHDANRLIARYLEPGGKLTPEDRESLDIYNESLRLEAEPLERDLRAKHGHVIPVRQQIIEKARERRSTRSNANVSAAYGTGLRQWMRRTFGV